MVTRAKPQNINDVKYRIIVFPRAQFNTGSFLNPFVVVGYSTMRNTTITNYNMSKIIIPKRKLSIHNLILIMHRQSKQCTSQNNSLRY